MKRHYQVAKSLAHLLDNKFKVGNFSFGLDPLLDFIPGLGDVIALILSFYIIWIAKQAHVPDAEMGIMIRNVVIDFVLGLIPIIGYVGDFIYKANVKNLAILEKYLDKSIIEAEVVSK